MNIKYKYIIAVAQFIFLVQMSFSSNINDTIAAYGLHVLERNQLPSISKHDFKEDSAAYTEQNVSHLIDWLLQLRKKEAITEYGIEVTTEELNIILENTLKGRSEYIRKTNEAIVRLPTALRAAKKSPDKTDTIYTEYLEGIMSYGLWQAHLAAQYGDEEIERMEKRNPIEEDELDSLIEPLRQLTLNNRLREHIERDATISTDTSHAWEHWCLRQLMEAHISIYDEHIKAAYDKRIDEYSREINTRN